MIVCSYLLYLYNHTDMLLLKEYLKIYARIYIYIYIPKGCLDSCSLYITDPVLAFFNSSNI